MDMATVEASTFMDVKEALTDEQFLRTVKMIRSSALEQQKLHRHLTKVVRQDKSLDKEASSALRVAQGYFALRDYAQALDWLEKAGASKQQCYLKGRTLQTLDRYEEASQAYEQAESKGWDSFEAAMKAVECLRQAGRLAEAEERLHRVSRVGDIRAEYHFQMGQLKEAQGLHDASMEEYEQAIVLDGKHTGALFYLAFATDLYGDEERAIELYKRCIASGNVHTSALLNLAVLYEERIDYDKAERCVKRVLAANPNHERARMFLKDIVSSKTMYYDEDQERRIDRQNQVLEIPISDFELSVRSRNCLKKMNIKYIGDLLRVTETELLAYKNFGETSLQEIKVILTQKGLRLGQLLDDRGSELRRRADEEEVSEDENELLSAPIGDLELSVRARKCLQRLDLQTIGDLAKRTEAELLGVKNFGMMSLNEIKQRLKDRGLSLRRLDD